MSKETNNDDVASKSKWERMADEQQEEQPVESVEADHIETNTNAQQSHDQDEQSHDIPSDSSADSGDAEATDNALQNQVESLKLKIATYQDQTARAVAEMDNMRRRTERDISQARLFANERLIKDLLPVIDSLVRAQEGLDKSDPKQQSMLEGVVLTADLLEKTLTSSGLEVINPEVGTTFNPDLHEAMSMVPNSDANKNDVIQVLQKGYQLNGRVIRAAMVIVAS